MLKIKAGISKVLGWLCVVFFAVLVLVTVWQVFTRQVLHAPSTWSEELSKVTFVWLSFLGSAFVLGERGHIAIDFLARKMPLWGQQISAIIVQLIVIFFAVIGLIMGGINAAVIAWPQNLTALPLSIGWIYAVIPLTGVIMTFFAATDLYLVASGKETPYPDIEEATALEIAPDLQAETEKTLEPEAENHNLAKEA